MSKRKDRMRVQAIFECVTQTAALSQKAAHSEREETDNEGGHAVAPLSDATLLGLRDFASLASSAPVPRRPLSLMKKFRFQLLEEWITANIKPCRVADIGGGKGLMAYLLNQRGYRATTIDPVAQSLPAKYKDLAADRQVRISETESVPRLDASFAPEMAQDFDLLVAMHAHGCNIQIIEAARAYRRDFLLLPCCIIGEPLRPAPGVHWLQCVADYARSQGFVLRSFRLNFKGQNIGLYARNPETEFSPMVK